MKTGIIGTGNMGRTLGFLWAERGHQLFFASTDPEKAQSVASVAGGRMKAGTYDEAAGKAFQSFRRGSLLVLGDLVFYSLRDA